MNTEIDREQLTVELTGWAVRGILCAVPSALWAFFGGYRQPRQIAAMVIGVTGYIVLYALLCTILKSSGRPFLQKVAAALRQAAWLKIGWCAVGAVFTFSGVALKATLPTYLIPCVAAVMADLWSGIGSIECTRWLGRLGGHDFGGPVNSLLWTGVTTVLQGMFVSVEIFALTTVLLAWQWAKVRFVIFRRPHWAPE